MVELLFSQLLNNICFWLQCIRWRQQKYRNIFINRCYINWIKCVKQSIILSLAKSDLCYMLNITRKIIVSYNFLLVFLKGHLRWNIYVSLKTMSLVCNCILAYIEGIILYIMWIGSTPLVPFLSNMFIPTLLKVFLKVNSQKLCRHYILTNTAQLFPEQCVILLNFIKVIFEI